MTLKLTEATANDWGSVECTDDLTITKWICKFKIKSTGGTGGKRTLFCFYVDDLEAGLPTNGYYVSFNEEDDKIRLIRVSAGTSSTLWETSLTNIDDGSWHEIEVRFDEGVVEIEWDDSRVLMYEIPSPDYTYSKWGFYAECSTYTNEHWIDDLDMFALMPFRDLRTMDREDIWRFRPLFWRVMRSPIRIHMPIRVRGISIKGRGSEGAPIELYSRFPVKISARKKPLIWHITPDVKGFGDYDGIQIDIDTKNQFMKIGTPTVDLFRFSESGSAEFFKDLRILKDDAKITFGSAEDIILERESATVLKVNSIMKAERDAPAFFVMSRKDIGREWFWGVTSLGRLYLRDYTGGISVLQVYPDTGKLDFNYETVMKGRSTFETDFLLKDQGTAGLDRLVKVVDGLLMFRDSADTGYAPIDIYAIKIAGTEIITSNRDVQNIRMISPLVKDVDATPVDDRILKVIDGILLIRDSTDTSYAPIDLSDLKIAGTTVIDSNRDARNLRLVEPLLKDIVGTSDLLLTVDTGVLKIRDSANTSYMPIDLSDLKIGGTIVIDSNRDVQNIRLVSPLVKDVGATPTDGLLKVVDGVLYVRDSGDTSYLPTDIASLKIGGTEVVSSTRDISAVNIAGSGTLDIDGAVTLKNTLDIGDKLTFKRYGRANIEYAFESLDGFEVGGTTGYSVTLNTPWVVLTTYNTIGDKAYIKDSDNYVTIDDDPVISFRFFLEDTTDYIYRLGIICANGSKAYIKVDGAIYSVSEDSTGNVEEKTLILVPSKGYKGKGEIIITPTKIDFYIEGSIGTGHTEHSTYLPSGTIKNTLWAEVETETTLTRTLRIASWKVVTDW